MPEPVLPTSSGPRPLRDPFRILDRDQEVFMNEHARVEERARRPLAVAAVAPFRARRGRRRAAS